MFALLGLACAYYPMRLPCLVCRMDQAGGWCINMEFASILRYVSFVPSTKYA